MKKIVFAAALLAIGASGEAASNVMDGVTVHTRHGHEGSQLMVRKLHKDPTRFAASVKPDDAAVPTVAAPTEPATAKTPDVTAPAATNAAPAK